jgi:amino acid permease
MEDNKPSRRSTKITLVITACYIIGIAGFVAAVANADGTCLIASSIAFASLLYYFKNDNS